MALVCLIFSAHSQTGNFITVWENNQGTPTLEVEIAINPDVNLTYNYSVDWGDGTTEQNLTTSKKHVYPDGVQRTIVISGDFPALFMKGSSTAVNLEDIEEWGYNMEWETMTHAFSGCINLGTISATDVPDLSNATDMSYMFHNCKSMQGGSSSGSFGSWDVSTITNMRGVFFGAENFDRQITTWDVTNVTDMTSMFENAKSYNRSMKWWVTTSLEKMSFMFAGAESFNRNVFNNFDVSNVQEFDGVFKNALAFEGKDPNDTDPSDKDISDWDMSSATSLNSMFAGAESFDFDISIWDVSSVEDFNHVFHGAYSFNQNLGDWDLSSAEEMEYTLSGSGILTCNYEETLDGWSLTAGSNVVLGADGLVYYDQTGRNSLLSNSWTINGDIENRIDECNLISDSCGEGRSTFFITTWVVPSSDVISIPTGTGTYDYDVDWESDGIWDVSGATSSVSCTTHTEGETLRVSIRGDFPTITFFNSGEEENIVSIEQWGCIEWETFANSFHNCTNLEYNATDAPNLTNVTTMISAFRNCESFNGNLNNWDVSTVEVMQHTFSGASSFNGDITDWNTSSCTDMSSMFSGASSFDQDINFNSGNNAWNVSNVVTFANMFFNASAFDGDITDWVTSSATNMSGMFRGAESFNQSINHNAVSNAWDVVNVQNFDNMFQSATSFNGNIADWETNSATSMTSMFASATNFNIDIEDWDVEDVESMASMFFQATSFNQKLSDWNVGNVIRFNGTFHAATNFNNGELITTTNPSNPLTWDVSSCTTMVQMFRGTGFNQDISEWETGNVISMEQMFLDDHEFNQPLVANPTFGYWDVSNVLDFSSMFLGTVTATDFNQDISSWVINTSNTAGVDMHAMFYRSSFNQDISSWNVSNVTDMSNMFHVSLFNQDIDSWNVGNVTNMYRMFKGSSFNQDIGSWDLSSIDPAFLDGNNDLVGSLVEMLDDCQMNQANFEATLDGWEANTSTTTPSSLTLGAQGRSYCGTSHSGHDDLINNSSWTINGAADICFSQSTTNPVLTPSDYIIDNSNGMLRVRDVTNSNTEAQIMRVRLYDMNGQLIYQSAESTGIDISTSGLSKGVYLINIETNEGIESKKVSIQ